MKKLVVVAFLGAGLAACSGGGSGSNGVTGSSAATMPQVAGSYFGTLDIFFPELGMSVSCPTSTVVTQTGSTISLTPFVAGGDCDGMSVPVGFRSIDSNGAVPNESGSFNDPDCGIYSYSASGGFVGRELRFTVNATSTTCWNMDIAGALER
jgi:hypothetical protein